MHELNRDDPRARAILERMLQVWHQRNPNAKAGTRRRSYRQRDRPSQNMISQRISCERVPNVAHDVSFRDNTVLIHLRPLEASQDHGRPHTLPFAISCPVSDGDGLSVACDARAKNRQFDKNENNPITKAKISPGSPPDKLLADVLKPVPPKSPAEAVKLFETQAGFRMELVAHEPDVTDPVAACFDENGGMYVAEMIDYPYRPKEGQTPLGRVRYLQDTDDDGIYDKSSIFAEHIAWPTGVVCWKGGVFVAAAPDIWYLKDEDGDHRADVRKKIYTGFGDRNQQGGVNNLNWHVDHTIYGSGSTNGGDIRPVDKPGVPPIVLSNRDFRFDPVSAASKRSAARNSLATRSTIGSTDSCVANRTRRTTSCCRSTIWPAIRCWRCRRRSRTWRRA